MKLNPTSIHNRFLIVAPTNLMFTLGTPTWIWNVLILQQQAVEKPSSWTKHTDGTTNESWRFPPTIHETNRYYCLHGNGAKLPPREAYKEIKDEVRKLKKNKNKSTMKKSPLLLSLATSLSSSGALQNRRTTLTGGTNASSTNPTIQWTGATADDDCIWYWNRRFSPWCYHYPLYGSL